MGIALGIVFVIAGLLVFLFAAEITNRLSAILPSDPGAGNQTDPGFAPPWYGPYVVWGFGFALIGTGVGLLRMVFFSSVGGYVGGGGMAGDMPVSPEWVRAHLDESSVRVQAAPPMEKTVVRVKCRNCGSLESEDAVYCRKCGKPL